MKKLFIALSLLIAFLSIRAQNTALPMVESKDLTLLKGDWAVVSQTISPLGIAPRCKPIQKGTIFQFTEKELKVFIDTSGKPCDVYAFKIGANTMSIIKEDMIWLCTYELDIDLLKIKSNNFFTPHASDMSLPVNKQPVSTQGIEVTLIKQHT